MCVWDRAKEVQVDLVLIIIIHFQVNGGTLELPQGVTVKSISLSGGTLKLLNSGV